MSRFYKGDVILSPDAVRNIRFIALPPREESTWIPLENHGPPDWWFRFGLHYVLMGAIIVGWLSLGALALLFLTGGFR